MTLVSDVEAVAKKIETNVIADVKAVEAKLAAALANEATKAKALILVEVQKASVSAQTLAETLKALFLAELSKL